MKTIMDVSIPDYDLAGKVAIVTGGSSGIGRAAAIQMASCGASVVIASLPEGDCVKVCGEISSFGGSALSLPTDVADERQVASLIEQTVAAFHRVDIFVSNAANGGKVLPLLAQSSEDFDELLKINLRSVFICGKAAAAQMIRQGSGGRIINMSSIAYVEGRGHHGLYGATKGGVSTITRTMAAEWAEHGINVNAVAPGLTMTPMNKALLTAPDVFNTLMEKIPLKRMAHPSEIAAAVLFLASDASSFMTGTTLFVDGGATIGG